MAQPFHRQPSYGPGWLEQLKHLSLGSGIALAGIALAVGYVIATVLIILSALIKVVVLVAVIAAAYLVVDFFRSGDDDLDPLV